VRLAGEGALAEEIGLLLRRAERELLAEVEEPASPLLDRAAIENRLPHRDPLLLIDRVNSLDMVAGTIVAGFPIYRAAGLLAGHFPGRPIFPGVLQVEAIGQAGAIAVAARGGEGGSPALTQILGAKFMAPVEPKGEGEDLIIVAKVLDDGLFFVIVGQCLFRGRICSVAALRGLSAD
jgi:3-hydroxyacyl-[acyl-carrier-protein] dehydratase